MVRDEIQRKLKTQRAFVKREEVERDIARARKQMLDEGRRRLAALFSKNFKDKSCTTDVKGLQWDILSAKPDLRAYLPPGGPPWPDDVQAIEEEKQEPVEVTKRPSAPRSASSHQTVGRVSSKQSVQAPVAAPTPEPHEEPPEDEIEVVSVGRSEFDDQSRFGEEEQLRDETPRRVSSASVERKKSAGRYRHETEDDARSSKSRVPSATAFIQTEQSAHSRGTIEEESARKEDETATMSPGPKVEKENMTESEIATENLPEKPLD